MALAAASQACCPPQASPPQSSSFLGSTSLVAAASQTCHPLAPLPHPRHPTCNLPKVRKAAAVKRARSGAAGPGRSGSGKQRPIASKESNKRASKSSASHTWYQAKETYENPVDLLLEPKWTMWDYSDMTELLKGAMKKLRDTLESGLQLQEENVTLDPSSDYWYEVSQDQKSAKGVEPDEDLFIYIYKYRYSSPMRFVHYPWVFGSQKFSTGKHFWEVIVGGTAGWAVGVAHLDDCGQNLFWHFVKCGRKYTAISPSESSDLVLTEEPTRIRVSLNCEGGQVSFFDASTATVIHTLSDASLVGEILQPCICVDVDTCLTFS